MEYFEYKELKYGLIKGSNLVLLIKVGSDGTIDGYNNKYLNIAIKTNNLYGATVIVCNNPHELEPSYNIGLTMEIVNSLFKEDYQVYYMGHSAGALQGAWYGYKYDVIKRMLLINSPLMFNLHKFKEGITKFNGNNIEIVYGSLDQSYRYTELLKPLLNDRVKLTIIDNKDHHFSGEQNDFIDLPIKYLFY